MPQKGKHRPPHRREKKQHARAAAPHIQEAVTGGPSPSPAAPKVVPAAKVQSRAGYPAQSTAALTKNRYPYLTAELKWIGIIALATVVVLIILAIVIPPLFA